MTKTSLRSIIICGTWMSVMTPTHSSKIIDRSNLNVRTLFPLSRDILVARDQIVGITCLVLSRSRQILFTRTVIQYPCHRTHRSRACKLRGCWVTEWARRISFCHLDGQIPILIHATPQVLSKVPEKDLYDHPFTVWRLMSRKHSSDTRKWHYLMVEGIRLQREI